MLMFGLVVSGVGALLVYGGIVDPPGGVFAELGRVLSGKPLTKAGPPARVADTGGFVGPTGGGSDIPGDSSGPYNSSAGVGGDFAHGFARAAGLAKATAMIGTAVPVGRCLHYAAVFYGLNASGVNDAARWWTTRRADVKHPNDRNPPPGALVCWTGGSGGFGHIGVADGFGNVISTDFPTSGRIGRAKLSSIGGGSLTYAGWSEPSFPEAGKP